MHGTSSNPKPPPHNTSSGSMAASPASSHAPASGEPSLEVSKPKPAAPNFWDSVIQEAREKSQQADAAAVPKVAVRRWKKGPASGATGSEEAVPKRAAPAPPIQPPPLPPPQIAQKGKGGQHEAGAKGKGKGKYRGGPHGLSGDNRTFTEEKRGDYHDTRKYRAR